MNTLMRKRAHIDSIEAYTCVCQAATCSCTTCSCSNCDCSSDITRQNTNQNTTYTNNHNSGDVAITVHNTEVQIRG